MNATKRLHDMGQSLWLDNITRDMLEKGTLARYIAEHSVTGLTSNPTIFDNAIRKSSAYDASIQRHARAGRTKDELVFGLILEDLTRAADLFRPVHERTGGVDGWVSLEVAPALAFDTPRTIAAAKSLSQRAARPNLYIKIPGTKEGLPAIEESIFAGVPINVTLIFSREQYLAAADAWARGIERRIEAGLPANVSSVNSLFISRWDVAVASKVPESLRNRIGVAVTHSTYAAARKRISSPRWQRLYNFGARPQRPLWASTGTKDPKASDLLYIESLAAPYTVNTMPEATLLALADHGRIGPPLSEDDREAEATFAAFRDAVVDREALATQLQKDGAAAFVKSWDELVAAVETKAAALR